MSKIIHFQIQNTFKQIATELTEAEKIFSEIEKNRSQLKRSLKTPYYAPRSVLELQVSKIWEEVLGISPIGIKDDLFILGASSLSVARIANRIYQTFAKELSLTTIFQAPTVEQITDLLCKDGLSLPTSSLAAIQPNGSKPPLFLCEGVSIYCQLIPYLGLEQPIYGLMRELSANFDESKVENIAKQYLREIQKVQPEGPYFIGGLSFGGLLAFEIAQQLHSISQEVALLVLFDTPGPDAYTLNPLYQRIWGHLSNLFRFGWPYLKIRIDKITRKFSWIFPKNTHSPKDSVTIISDQLIREFYKASAKEYQPKVYPGRLTLFVLNERQALTDSLFDPALGNIDPFLGWGNLATGGVEVCKVLGEHTSMFAEPYVSDLGEKLKAYLEQAHVPARIIQKKG